MMTDIYADMANKSKEMSDMKNDSKVQTHTLGMRIIKMVKS